MVPFKVGDIVIWSRAVPQEHKDSVGRIVAIVSCDSGTVAFTLYDVQFERGLHTLYGTQIEFADSKRRAQSSGTHKSGL
jgi:hypothetical protein